MYVEPIESVLAKIMTRYNRAPKGWTVLTDLRGNVLVLGPRTGYRLKLVPLNPHEYTGVGLKIDDLKEMKRVVNDGPSYGFRPLSSRNAQELLGAFNQGRSWNRLLNEVLETNPIPTGELKRKSPRAFLSGPIIAHPNLSDISAGQKKLEAKLAVEAGKLFKRKYPGRAETYR